MKDGGQMKKAVIYARVSSKEQEREGFSIPAQLRLLHEYAFRNDFSVLRGSNKTHLQSNDPGTACPLGCTIHEH
jgi:hypothetical protein